MRGSQRQKIQKKWFFSVLLKCDWMKSLPYQMTLGNTSIEIKALVIRPGRAKNASVA